MFSDRSEIDAGIFRFEVHRFNFQTFTEEVNLSGDHHGIVTLLYLDVYDLNMAKLAINFIVVQLDVIKRGHFFTRSVSDEFEEIRQRCL